MPVQLQHTKLRQMHAFLVESRSSVGDPPEPLDCFFNDLSRYERAYLRFGVTTQPSWERA